MISIDEIDKTILDLEQHDTTYATCEKLAWLYIVKDHLANTPLQNVSRETSPEFGNSEFLFVASNVDIIDLMKILDEHMDVVRLIMPNEYESLIRKIRELA